jgi:chromosome segregation ATPase
MPNYDDIISDEIDDIIVDLTSSLEVLQEDFDSKETELEELQDRNDNLERESNQIEDEKSDLEHSLSEIRDEVDAAWDALGQSTPHDYISSPNRGRRRLCDFIEDMIEDIATLEGKLYGKDSMTS